MNCRKIVWAALLALTGCAWAAEPFDQQLASRKMRAESFTAPKAFAPGAFEVKLALCNLDRNALRGTLEVSLAEENGRKAVKLAEAAIDLPPESVSKVPQDLVAKGEISRKAVGRKVRVELLAGGQRIALREGVVMPKALAGTATAASPDALPQNVRHAFRYLAKFDAAAGTANLDFIENGGVVCVGNLAAEADFAGAAAYVEPEEMPKFKVQKGKANPYDTSVSAGRVHWLDWPHALSPRVPLGDNRLELPGAASRRWEAVQQRGQPVTVILRFGLGALVLSTHDAFAEGFRRELEENFSVQYRLEERGFAFREAKDEYALAEEYMGKVAHPTVYGGTSLVGFRATHDAATNLLLAARLTFRDAAGRTRVFIERARGVNRKGENCDLRFALASIDLSGPCTATYELFDWKSGANFYREETRVTLDPPFAIVPPDYRKSVSTRRADAAVKIGLRLVTPFDGAKPAKWTLVAKDAMGTEVAKCEGAFAPGATFVETALPLAAEAPAGTYALEATVERDGRRYEARETFDVVAPEKGQILVDQDGFFLRDGEPYFPLGIYHCHTFNWETPIDDTGLRAMDMGFNWMQLWEWDWRNHLSLDRDILAEYVDKQLAGPAREAAIDALVATNRRNRALFKGVTIAYEGFGIWEKCFLEHPAEGGRFTFEDDPRIPVEVKKISEDPDNLVGMWYLADEAGGNFCQPLGRATALLRKHDPKMHPTFNLGNLPAVMGGDTGGNDIYVRYYGGLGSARTFADRVDAMTREYARFHRRPLVVPQAFGQSPRQPTETPEWVRIEAYLSVIHGANGIGFYCWAQTGDWKGTARQGMAWNPPTAHEVRKLIAEIKTFQLALRDPDRRLLVSDDGNVDACLCGDAKSGRFLICANVLEGAVETRLTIPGVKPGDLEPLFGAAKPEKAGGFLGFGASDLLALKLPAWGTAVYRVK